LLNGGVKRFNYIIVEGRWEEEKNLNNAMTTPIAVLDDIITVDDDTDD